ncbi:hypothetical protein KR009_002018, partial [Drosophila setifemur]
FSLPLFADSFSEGDIVFAQKRGYMVWPGMLLAKHSRAGLVQFMSTNDRHHIPYGKIWPYDDRSKKQFVTSQGLEYEEFREAMSISESILYGCGLSDGTDWRLIKAHEEPRISKDLALPQGIREVIYVQQVRKQRDTLHVEGEFIREINALRSSLTRNKQDYPSAQLAFNQLQALPLSQLLLVRNFEAVDAILQLCRFTSEDPQKAKEAKRVRALANILLTRFASHFMLPYTTSGFWSEFCLLSGIYRRYTVDI